MDARKQVEKMIAKKEAERTQLLVDLDALKIKIERTEAHIEAHRETLKLFPKEIAGANADAAALKEGSATHQAYIFLRARGVPAHSSEIVVGLGKQLSKADAKRLEQTISSSLASYSRQGKIFTKTGPNIYGLIEFEDAPDRQLRLDVEPLRAVG